MKDANCAYCMQGELVARFAYPVCKMDTGFLYVFKEQSHPGRLILAHEKHIHLVPKYEGGAEWGGVFEMNPGKVLLTDKEYEEIAEKIRQAL